MKIISETINIAMLILVLGNIIVKTTKTIDSIELLKYLRKHRKF